MPKRWHYVGIINKNHMELRDYQVELSKKGAEILLRLQIVYYCMEVRTGKTLTALNTIKLAGYKNALFLTKKKAIKSIQKDYDDFGYEESFMLLVANNESLHLIEDIEFDVVVMDEAHRFGAFPKPGKGITDFKSKFSHLPIIFLSGTPHPESFSQVYHQFWVSHFSPFKEYGSFYKWFTEMGCFKTEFDLGFGVVANYTNNIEVMFKYFAIKQRSIKKEDPNYDKLNMQILKEISSAKEMIFTSNKNINEILDPYFIKFTQAEAGFTTEVKEHVLTCKMNEITYRLINKLKKDRVIKGSEETILADTPVKLMSKIHQLSSGTIKFESGNSQVIDCSKGEYVKEFFKGYKIAMFYKFQSEYQMLKQVFGDDLVSDLEVFNSTDKHIALQVVSGREGISLKAADYLVFINIDFSAISYFQAKDRLTTMDRKTNDIYWVFSENGIEHEIYKTVMGKKDYTLTKFKKSNGI